MGFEPTTLGLGSRCSTAELHPLATPDYSNPASASATSPSRGNRPASALLKTFFPPAFTTNLPPDDGTITTACRRSACSVRISSATRAACPSYPHSAQYSISTCTFPIAILPSTLADLKCVTFSVPAGYVWRGSGGGRSTPVPGARARRSEEMPERAGKYSTASRLRDHILAPPMLTDRERKTLQALCDAFVPEVVEQGDPRAAVRDEPALRAFLHRSRL